MEFKVVFIDEMISQQDWNGEKVLLQPHIRRYFIDNILKSGAFERIIHFRLKVEILSKTQENTRFNTKISGSKLLIISHIARNFYTQ